MRKNAQFHIESKPISDELWPQSSHHWHLAPLKAKGSILLVESNPERRPLLAQALSLGLCHVWETENANAALREIGRRAFELVVISQHLDDEKGIELARTLRRTGYSMPIIVLSEAGTNVPSPYDATLKSVTFLPGPVHPVTLAVTAAFLLRETRLQPEPVLQSAA